MTPYEAGRAACIAHPPRQAGPFVWVRPFGLNPHTMFAADGSFTYVYAEWDRGYEDQASESFLDRQDEEIRVRERQGDWFLSFTGKQIYPFDMRVEDVCIEDIAHSLSIINRFNGHTIKPYSVAQHCVLMSQLIDTDNEDPFQETGIQFQALMHDAAEAYCGDVIRPIKRALTPLYNSLEDGIWAAIAARYGLPLELDQLDPAVKAADLHMLQTERRDLLPASPAPWKVTETYAPYWQKIHPWSAEIAETAFLQRFGMLCREV